MRYEQNRGCDHGGRRERKPSVEGGWREKGWNDVNTVPADLERRKNFAVKGDEKTPCSCSAWNLRNWSGMRWYPCGMVSRWVWWCQCGGGSGDCECDRGRGSGCRGESEGGRTGLVRRKV